MLGESVCFLPTPTPGPTDSEAGDTNTGAYTHGLRQRTHAHTCTPLRCGSGAPAASILEPHLDESKSQKLERAKISMLEEKPGSQAGQPGVPARPARLEPACPAPLWWGSLCFSLPGLSAWSSKVFWKGGERVPRPRGHSPFPDVGLSPQESDTVKTSPTASTPAGPACPECLHVAWGPGVQRNHTDTVITALQQGWRAPGEGACEIEWQVG